MGGDQGRVEKESTASTSSPSSTESLLFATLCLIGLPVDVHVKDGSVYSGVFHTASVEKGYGIVLKKAKLTKKGRWKSNVASGDVVETLVILPGDFAQLVSREILLSVDGLAGNVAGDNAEAQGIVPSSNGLLAKANKPRKSVMDKRTNHKKRSSIQNENDVANGFIWTKAGKENEGEKLLPDHMGYGKGLEFEKRDGTITGQSKETNGAPFATRQVEDDMMQALQDDFNQKFVSNVKESSGEVEGSNPSSEACPIPVKPIREGNAEKICRLLHFGASHEATAVIKPQSFERSADTFQDAIHSSVSTSSTPVTDVTLESHGTSMTTVVEMVPPQNSESSKSSKEFKLNPEAKIFSPSFVNPILVGPPAVPTVPNTGYMPGNSPTFAGAGSQPEVGMGPFVPRSSAPAKFIQYSNMTAGNGVTGPQFSQPIVGHIGGRAQPLRYAGQYHPAQATPPVFNPNSQAAMVGRLGQLVYMQPATHDLVQGAAGISSIPPRPSFTPHQVQHQGNSAGQGLQLCVPQPYMPPGQQPLAVPSQIPLMQPPFPATRPTPGTAVSNGHFGAKLP
ncbi:hypothetical protein SLA2020_322100 [Shorea laevis]